MNTKFELRRADKALAMFENGEEIILRLTGNRLTIESASSFVIMASAPNKFHFLTCSEITGPVTDKDSMTAIMEEYQTQATLAAHEGKQAEQARLLGLASEMRCKIADMDVEKTTVLRAQNGQTFVDVASGAPPFPPPPVPSDQSEAARKRWDEPEPAAPKRKRRTATETPATAQEPQSAVPAQDLPFEPVDAEQTSAAGLPGPDDEPFAADWQGYVIQSVKNARYKGRTLQSMSGEEIDALQAHFSAKVASSPAAVEDAKMVAEAWREMQEALP